jgi:hypothetical protein
VPAGSLGVGTDGPAFVPEEAHIVVGQIGRISVRVSQSGCGRPLMHMHRHAAMAGVSINTRSTQIDVASLIFTTAPSVWTPPTPDLTRY